MAIPSTGDTTRNTEALVQLLGGMGNFIPLEYDHIDGILYDAGGNMTQVVFWNAGVQIGTLTMTYNAGGDLLTATRTTP